MQQRKLMLEGKRPSECEYCWKIEDAPGNNISDRLIKSIDSWAFDKLDETLKMTGDERVAPTYLEVIFSSECNLSCAYCIPDVSSSIAREMEKFGPYPNLNPGHRMPRYKEVSDDNPYIKAFWNWFPEILPGLKVFRITGGEPLLSANTFKVLEYLENHPNPELELVINTNLSFADRLLEKYLAQIKVLIAKGCIGKYSTYTSLDGYGEQSVYIRKNLDFERFNKNLELLSTSLPHNQIIIMCTFNLLSIGSFDKMLLWIDALKRQGKNIILDISYLRDPDHLRTNIMDESLEKILLSSLQLMKSLSSYSAYETAKFERVVNWATATRNDRGNLRLRGNFIQFINEFDRRYQSNFSETFPEYNGFLKVCNKTDIWMKLFNHYT